MRVRVCVRVLFCDVFSEASESNHKTDNNNKRRKQKTLKKPPRFLLSLAACCRTRAGRRGVRAGERVTKRESHGGQVASSQLPSRRAQSALGHVNRKRGKRERKGGQRLSSSENFPARPHERMRGM